ncbi:MAG: NUDIX hydrolase [Chloroflexi bacterium]|nr:NUDIX hydrolase [Chloroflexota bacterium]
MANNMPQRLVYDGFLKVKVVETPEGPREVVQVTNSVSILLFNPDEKYVLLIRQARVPMISDSNPGGFIVETVAGRFDINVGVTALAIKEAQEEVGATIEESDVVLLNGGKPLALSPGVLTERAYLAMAKVDVPYGEATDRVFGVADEGESIQRVFMKFDEITDYLNSGQCEDLRVFTLLSMLLMSENFE